MLTHNSEGAHKLDIFQCLFQVFWGFVLLLQTHQYVTNCDFSKINIIHLKKQFLTFIYFEGEKELTGEEQRGGREKGEKES